MKFNRRELLKNAALVSGATLAAAPFYSEKNLFGQLTLPTLPNPENSGIEHIVVVTMENRSFDHFLGWLPACRRHWSTSHGEPQLRSFPWLVDQCRRQAGWLDVRGQERRLARGAFALR